MAKVAFIGLGVMGYPMAGHLLKKGGHELTVYNRNAAKSAWVKTGAGRAPTPAKPRRTRTSSSAVSATTTTCVR